MYGEMAAIALLHSMVGLASVDFDLLARALCSATSIVTVPKRTPALLQHISCAKYYFWMAIVTACAGMVGQYLQNIVVERGCVQFILVTYIKSARCSPSETGSMNRRASVLVNR